MQFELAHKGADRLNVASCCPVVMWRRLIVSRQPLWEWFGRRHSMMGQHDAGCCVAGSVFPAQATVCRTAS